jgi:PAS domain-containing protein
VASTADRQRATSGTAQLAARVGALRQAAALPGAQLRPLLDAALAELGAALDGLGAADPHQPGEPDDTRLHSAAGSERRLLHAVFQQTPVPLFLLGRDGTIRRANSAAGLLLGVGPGYAAGKLFTALIEPSGRAVVQSRLAAVARSAQPGQLDCSLLAANGRVHCELAVRPSRSGAATTSCWSRSAAAGQRTGPRARAAGPRARSRPSRPRRPRFRRPRPRRPRRLGRDRRMRSAPW